MTELVETIAKALVDAPDHVVVTEEDEGSEEILRLTVAGDDMGKVIGKKGRIAKALRTVVKAAATKQNKQVSVGIFSEDEMKSAEAEEE
ncbi:MAG: KH domain-containing protein [Eubacteriales bacterium]|nr:KH domain-containing protein [Eubacteriales bacterium]